MELPSKCFISYSYKDVKAHKRLLKALSKKKLKLFTFPPITITPDKMVSSKLIEAILDHEGLIYLEGGYSAQSFWVAFERDYALRAGKKVYAFNPETLELKRHTFPPLELHVFISHVASDRDKVAFVIRFMREERFFDALSFDLLPTFRGAKDKQIRQNIVEKINRGGYLVTFLSKRSETSSFQKEEVEFALNYGQFFSTDKTNPDFNRVIFALLENIPLPKWLNERIQLNPNSVISPVQLYSDKALSMTNRIDDLIVRLYWLIYRNTQQNGLQ